MRRQMGLLIVLGLLIVAGCKSDTDNVKEESKAPVESLKEEEKAETVKEIEPADEATSDEATSDVIAKVTVVEEAEKPITETQAEEVVTPDFLFPNEEIKVFVEQTVVLSDDTMIEAYEWVKESEVLRARIQYKEQPEDNYLHKEDYFFFLANGEIVGTLYVDYPSTDFENMDKPRYVAEACGFEAHMEDVTFDGKEDLIISLGYGGSATFACAYIATEDGFEYNQSFEKIPSYEVDVQGQVIRGSNTHNALSYSEYEYRYENESFVLTGQKDFEYNEAIGKHELIE